MSTALTLAANLRSIMAERGLSPDDLARGCALDLARVRAALLGEGLSTLAEIERLGGWLGMPIEDLLAEHGVMQPADLPDARAQWQQYWALPADQRAQVDAFTRVRETAGHSRCAGREQPTIQSILSDAERRAVMSF